MSTALDAAYQAATANIGEQGAASGERPSVGHYTAQLVDARADTAKSGEFYMSVTFALQDGRRWDEVKLFTKEGILHEGKAKSAAIMLRGLGLVGEPSMPSHLPTTIKSLVNKFYSVEITQSNQVNPNTGEFYLNTEVNGPANPWSQAAAAPVPQSDFPAPPMTAQPPAPAPQAMAPTQVQTPQGMAQFPSAVPQAQPVAAAPPVAPVHPDLAAAAQQAPDAAVLAAAQQQQAIQQAAAQGFPPAGPEPTWDAGPVAPTPVQQGQPAQ